MKLQIAIRVKKPSDMIVSKTIVDIPPRGKKKISENLITALNIVKTPFDDMIFIIVS